MSAKDEERVLVLSRSVLFGPRGLLAPEPWRGLRRLDAGPLLDLAAHEGRFLRRGDVEGDPAWKQLIPYLVLREGATVFLMRRTRAGGDPRLHDRWTVGIGGHVNATDGDLHGALRREWREEIEADFEPELRPLGLLNDDEDPVGRVHLGVVFEADAGGRPVGIRETEALAGAFATPPEIATVAAGLETWSRLVLEALGS